MKAITTRVECAWVDINSVYQPNLYFYWDNQILSTTDLHKQFGLLPQLV